jgi:hypothetical protein
MLEAREINITNAKGYNDYLEKDLSEDGQETKTWGSQRWLSTMGLSGELPTPEEIERISEGRRANDGKQLASFPGAALEDRVFFIDLVFSVPKSVSVELAYLRSTGVPEDLVMATRLTDLMDESFRQATKDISELAFLGRREVKGKMVYLPLEVGGLRNRHEVADPCKCGCHRLPGSDLEVPEEHIHFRMLNLGLLEDGTFCAVNNGELRNWISPWNSLTMGYFKVGAERLGYPMEPVVFFEGEESERWEYDFVNRNAEANLYFSPRHLRSQEQRDEDAGERTLIQITNDDDLIEPSDIIARLHDLELMGANGREVFNCALEYYSLLKLADQCSKYSGWHLGITIVRDSFFADHTEWVAEQCGLIDTLEEWPRYADRQAHILKELQKSYSAVDFGGETYWIEAEAFALSGGITRDT